MSTAALVLAVITAGLSSAYYDECYDDSYDDSYEDSYDCYDGEFMTDPQSCCHYYVCDHGRPVRFVCGEGTYYSPDLQTCDHQCNVDCGTRSTEGCGGYNDSGPNNECDNDYYNNRCSNNDQNYNNGCDNYDQCDNNCCDNNYQYDNNDRYGNNGQSDNNGSGGNNQYYSEDNNALDVEDDYWGCTEEGTMYNPMQMAFGPSSDVPIKNLEAYNTIRGSKTVDDTYAVDDYYGNRSRS